MQDLNNGWYLSGDEEQKTDLLQKDQENTVGLFQTGLRRMHLDSSPTGILVVKDLQKCGKGKQLFMC